MRLVSYLMPDLEIIREAMNDGPLPRRCRVPLCPAAFGRLSPDEAELRHSSERGWHIARFFNKGTRIAPYRL